MVKNYAKEEGFLGFKPIIFEIFNCTFINLPLLVFIMKK